MLNLAILKLNLCHVMCHDTSAGYLTGLSWTYCNSQS